MRCKSCCWFGSLGAFLTAAVVAQAQPPVLDSTFIFESVNGVFGQMSELPDGDVLVVGRFGEDSLRSWEIGRMNRAHEFIWTRDIYATDSGEVGSACLNGDHILLQASERVYINENSWTTRRNYLCYTLGGDSLWANRLEDSVNYTSMGKAVGTDDGGFLIYGQESYLDSIFIRYHAKLVKLDASGEVVWERFFDGDNYSSGDIVKFSQDSVLVASIYYVYDGTDILFSFMDMAGNVGRTLEFHSLEQNTPSIGTTLLTSEHGIDLIWSSHSDSNLGVRLQLLRLDSTGALRLITSAEESVNRFRAFYPVASGLLTFGLPDYLMPRGIFVGHLGANHIWYYMERIPFDVSAPVYSMLTGITPTALGTIYEDTFTPRPAIFYFSPEGPASYLYSTPGQLDYGIVPLGETRELEFELVLTGETSVTVTEFINPQDYAISAQAPLTILPGEQMTVRMAFRPDERRHYVDTLYVVSSALNDTIFIPITGEAPYPLCEPDHNHIDLRWCLIGDTVSARLRINNPGTEPLHIAALDQPWPFWLGNTGPIVVPAESTFALTLFAAPIAVGIHNGLLVIQSDEPNSPDSIALTVRGVESPNDVNDALRLPREFRMLAAYPNPFNATAVIRFELPKAQFVKLELLDVTGRLVQKIVDQSFTAGEHQIMIDGAGLASGIYFANLNAGEFRAVQKLVLLK